ILPGVAIEGNSVVEEQTGPIAATIVSYLVIGLIFGLANAFIKPILSVLSAPITCLTLGLFSIVINAAMLALTSWLSGFTPFVFTIDSFFFQAILAAIIVSIVSALLGWLAPDSSRDRD
ncbi:phage holin family protein, partial [Burkholderia multivorans]